MPSKRTEKEGSRDKLVDDLHKAVKAYVEGNGGETWVIGPIQIVPRKPTAFDLVIECIGQKPT